MTATLTRRAAITDCLIAVPALFHALTRSTYAVETGEALMELERKAGGRLGVAALDTSRGTHIVHRGNERFAMCSTFKLLAVALVMTRVDRGDERLDRRIVFTADDLVEYSPITEKRTGGNGMTVRELCDAAITLSDNTAGNLLLASFGGPPALTAFARSLGDPVTRLDRIEVQLNEATPGDPRDTTTPMAMLEDVRRVLFTQVLSARSRDQLTVWLVANKTGDARLRAGLPDGWRVGDKTGAGNNGATNDVAVVWPPGRAPLIIAAYFAESQLSANQRNAVLADVARILASAF
jgi:beta-lactamase class A